jgi:hypothetical protein
MTEIQPMQYLAGRRLLVFPAVADTMLPAVGRAPSGGVERTARIADWALGRLPQKPRGKFLLLLLIVEFLGIFFGGKPFSKCAPEARVRLFAWMETNRLRLFRMGFFGLKNYVCVGYYTREDIWRGIGYAGPIEGGRMFPDAGIRALCQGEPGGGR